MMALALKPVAKTASFTLDRRVHQDQWVVCNAAAGMTVTLPASAGTGDKYKLFVGTTVTSNNFIVAVANATDIMAGGVAMSTDIGGTNMLAAATSDTITMNGSTKGGLKGSWLIIEDAVSGVWVVGGFLVCTGTEADPFSAAVS